MSDYRKEEGEERREGLDGLGTRAVPWDCAARCHVCSGPAARVLSDIQSCDMRIMISLSTRILLEYSLCTRFSLGHSLFT